MPLRHGRHPRRRRHDGRNDPRPVRFRRVRRRDARCEPTRRQLPLRPPRLRQAVRRVRGAVRARASTRRSADRRSPSSTSSSARHSRRSQRVDGENPFTVHHDLQETMQTLVGIIRTESDLAKALDEIQTLQERAAKARIDRFARATTPAGTWRSTSRRCSPCPSAARRAALERKESRGGHTRDDYPGPEQRVREGQHRVPHGRGRHDRDQRRSRCPRCRTSCAKIIEEQPT